MNSWRDATVAYESRVSTYEGRLRRLLELVPVPDDVEGVHSGRWYSGAGGGGEEGQVAISKVRGSAVRSQDESARHGPHFESSGPLTCKQQWWR